ncbi:hypothetical protein [Nocardia africana]
MGGEHLPHRRLGRRAGGDLGADERLLPPVDDRVHLVDHHSARRQVTGIAQMPDRLTGGHHDRGPPRRHRSEPLVLVGPQHVDSEAAQHPAVLGELPMSQPVRGRHQQHRTVANRLVHRIRHEHQRLALARQHLHRPPGHLEPALQLRPPQHHPSGHLIGRPPPDDLHTGDQRFPFVGVEQPRLQHLVGKVGQPQLLREVVTGTRVEVGQHLIGMVAMIRCR